MALSTSIRVQGDEILVSLEDLPQRIQRAVKEKLGQEVMPQLRQKVFEGRPGKYFDQSLIETGAEQLGSLVIGYLESTPKEGKYPITPQKARLLRFIGEKDGMVVRTKLVLHQYFSKEVVDHYLRLVMEQHREEIESAVEDAVRAATRRRRRR